MYVVHFILGKEHQWKTFNTYTQAMDYKSMVDKPIKVIKYCPTSPEPEIIWKASWNDKAKMPEPLVMPVIDDKRLTKLIDTENEKNLILEECVEKVHNIIYGFAEQIKRLTN